MDIYALYRNPRVLARLGVVFTVVVLTVGGLVFAQFGGAFSAAPVLRVQLPPASSVVAVDSPVTYRDVRIGTVVEGARSGTGDGTGALPEVRVRIDRKWLDKLPRDVVATVGPISIFGNQYVQLLATDDGGPAGLSDDAVVPAYDASRNPSLQGTFVALNDVLKEVSPARLNAGLSGLATALQGQGTELGETLVATNDYLGIMLPLWPTLVENLGELATFAGGLSEITPEFLSLIENASTTAKTVRENADSFRSLVSNGATLSTTSAALLNSTMDAYADSVDGAVALLAALSQGPDVITKMLKGIDSWASTWAPALADGMPDIRMAALSVRNPADLVLAMTAGGDADQLARLLNEAVRAGFANPSTYQRCPEPLCSFSRRPADGTAEGSTP
ncbi:MCE family protein [Nocardioides sp. BYT-33-1]|uniref:MCE family protein n=1 Tax=Nocardioides sp. BYT-33-1 TaxID=3416952 RepID=UPI003F52E6ED